MGQNVRICDPAAETLKTITFEKSLGSLQTKEEKSRKN